MSKRWPTVADYMDTVVHTLRPDAPILDAVRFLLDKHVTGAPVIDDAGVVVGMLTEFDCLRLLAEGANNEVPRGTVRDYMSHKIVTVPSRMDIYYAAGLFLGQRFRRLPVVDDGKLVGAITRFDILRAVERGVELRATAARERKTPGE